MKTTVVMSLVVLAVIGGLVYMSMNKSPADKMPANQTEQTTTEQPTASSTESGAMMEVKEIVIEGSNFKFDPNTITVKKGEKTKVVFKNVGGMHDFKVDELGIATEVIKDGEEETVEFTADKAGTFEFYCSVGQHRQMGMKGTLVVEE